ncbi:MAG TPA: hypothetical protein VGC26_11775 [Afipia sp.]
MTRTCLVLFTLLSLGAATRSKPRAGHRPSGVSRGAQKIDELMLNFLASETK